MSNTPLKLDLSVFTFNPPDINKPAEPVVTAKPVKKRQSKPKGPIITQPTANISVVQDDDDSHAIHDFTINEALFKPEELILNPVKDVFIKNSKITNDDLIKYYIIKYKILDYSCSSKNCPVKQNSWRRKPCYLILNRKNNTLTDLTTTNLTLICPNCYTQDKGADLFTEFKNKTESKCVSCSYPVKKGSTLCYVCDLKLKKMGSVTTVNDIAELTIRSSVGYVPSQKKKTSGVTTAVSDNGFLDIDKELDAITGCSSDRDGSGGKLRCGSLATSSQTNKLSLDEELAKYKTILDIDLETKHAKTNKLPSSHVHYTKKQTGPTTATVQDVKITDELLDILDNI